MTLFFVFWLVLFVVYSAAVGGRCGGHFLGACWRGEGRGGALLWLYFRFSTAMVPYSIIIISNTGTNGADGTAMPPL